MDRLHDLLSANEDWLMKRILSYAQAHRYTKYTSTLEEAWRISIVGISSALLAALEASPGIPELDPDGDYGSQPMTSFAILEAKRHRERGVSLQMFLGLFKYYRQSYMDLIEESVLDRDERRRLTLFTRRCFDRFELAFCSEWAGERPGGAMEELQNANRILVNVKNKYLTLFESMRFPVFLLDERDRIDNMNQAGAVFLGKNRSPGTDYYSPSAYGHGAVRQFGQDGITDTDALSSVPFDRVMPWLKRYLAEFHAANCADRIVEISHDDKFFEVHFSVMLDVSRKFAGVIIVLNDITQRRGAENALRASEERLKYIIKHNPTALAVFDKNLRYLIVSDKYMFDYGLTGKTVIGRRFDEGAADLPESWGAAYLNSLNGLVDAKEEDRIVRGNGTVDFVKWECRPWLDASNSIGGVVAYSEIITGRKNLEKALRDGELRFREIYDNAPVMMHSINTDQIICNVNRKWLQEMGYSRQEVIGKAIREFMTPESALILSRVLREFWTSRKVADLPYRYVTKDGSVIDVLLDSVAIDDPIWGRCSLSVVRNVTEHKRSEQIQIRLATAVSQSADAIVITDTDGVIEYVNPSFERITGYRVDEVLGRAIGFLKSGKQDSAFYANLWNTINRGEDWAGRLVNKRKDGSLYYEDQKISPVRDAAGRIINYVAVKRDVTQQVVIEKQLIQSQKMDALGTLVSGIAHDFNNILQVILGYADLLLMDKPIDAPDHAELEVIVKSARSGGELVQRLLAFGRKVESNFQAVDLNSEVGQVVKLLSRTIPKMIRIETSLEPNLTEVNGDPVQIERVLMNLAVNSKNAMPDGGVFVISTRNVSLTPKDCKAFPDAVPGDYALLSVSDTGFGMDKNTLERIFDPFFTTKSLGTDKGTGLGLSIVYGVVKQHNALICCESEPGQGARFDIYFPAITCYEPKEKPAPDLPPLGGAETILLVDDELYIRELGSRILGLAGYQVITAGDGREALEIYGREGHKIAAVVLDMAMPQMGGEECYRELIKIDPNVKVLVATGYAQETLRIDTFADHPVGYIAKPYQGNDMLVAVRRLLDHDKEV